MTRAGLRLLDPRRSLLRTIVHRSDRSVVTYHHATPFSRRRLTESLI